MRKTLRDRNVRAAGSWLLVLGLTASATTCAAFAGEEEDDGKKTVTHHSHHTIGERHEVVPFDATRFFTNRDSDVQLELPVEEDSFLFAVFGDRTGGPAEGIEVLKQAVKDANLIEPDLIMTVGDLVQGYNEEPQWMVQMREYKSVMADLLMPWFPVAGNHDVYWRGNGTKPDGEHESNYEMHFGPLWYAFEHKNCWFIALYTDEGDPETGERNFSKPECQKMSPEQFAWLEETLKRARGADHVFAFLHHPRWLKNNYGDDWDRVHELLAKQGNVSAVFAGHIHKLHYAGPRDGIEYVTLATVGGGQSGLAPAAGYLHQFHLVMVRENQIALASIPVGEVTDPRSITGNVSNDCATLARLRPVVEERIMLDSSGVVSENVVAKITNPVARTIEISLMPTSDDSRWYFTPDHAHATIKPGMTHEVSIYAMRDDDGTLDATFRPAELSLSIDYLAEGRRFGIPESRSAIPLRPMLERPDMADVEMVAELDGARDVFAVDDDLFELPDGPMTLECRFRGDSFDGRRGLVAKTENSDYGFFVSDGVPGFYIFLGDSYAEVIADSAVLKTDTWHHLAGVYDGEEVRLYLDGELIDSVERSGIRKKNSFPVYIGADVDGGGWPTSLFDGQIDAVRLSRSARYAGDSILYPGEGSRLSPDEETVLLFNMDEMQARWIYDESPSAAHARMVGTPEVVAVEN